MGYEFAGVRYDHVLDFYGGDVLMRKLLLIMALMAPGWSVAAVVVTPQIAGYSGGMYRAAAGSFAMTAANDGYIAQAVTNVAGRQVVMSSTMRMAANAGRYAIEGMRLNPWLLAGTLALPWLLDHGMEYVNGEWTKTVPVSGGGSGSILTTCSAIGDPNPCAYQDYSGIVGSVGFTSAVNQCYSVTIGSSGPGQLGNYSGAYYCVWDFTSVAARDASVQSTSIPATQSDFDNLPDPLSVVGPELPSAPYMPDGVPVTSPEYAPQDVPLGDPYNMPDGSTVQDRVSISPQPGGQVSIVTYNVTVNDAQGNPVTNPTPTPTPDPPPDFCQLHPESVACMSSGGPPTFVPPTDGGAPADPSIVAAGGAIDWHQHFLDESSACGLADVNYSVMNQQFTIPLSSLCQYLPILKAVVIFLASIVSIRMFALAPW